MTAKVMNQMTKKFYIAKVGFKDVARVKSWGDVRRPVESMKDVNASLRRELEFFKWFDS